MNGDIGERVVAALVRVENIGTDLAEMKREMARMAEAVVTLARVEERQQRDRDEIKRLFVVTDDHETRIGTIEKAQPLQQQTSKWVQHVVNTIVTLVLTAVVSTVIVKANFETRKADVPQLSAPAR